MKTTAEVGGWAAGTALGAKAGAAVGTCIGGPIGTAVGTVLGAACGFLGSWLASKAADKVIGPNEVEIAQQKIQPNLQQKQIQILKRKNCNWTSSTKPSRKLHRKRRTLC